MANEQNPKNIDIPRLIETMKDADLNLVVKELSNNKDNIEEQLRNLNPYLQTSSNEMIVDYAMILISLLPDSLEDNTQKRARIEALLSATFTVAFALGKGEEIAKTLPVLAMAGINNQLGHELLKHFSKTIKEIDNS